MRDRDYLHAIRNAITAMVLGAAALLMVLGIIWVCTWMFPGVSPVACTHGEVWVNWTNGDGSQIVGCVPIETAAQFK